MLNMRGILWGGGGIQEVDQVKVMGSRERRDFANRCTLYTYTLASGSERYLSL